MFQNNGDHVTISLNIPFAVGTLHALAVAGGFWLFLVVLLYALDNGRDLLGKLKRWHDKPVFNAVIWAGILLFPVWLALLALTLTGTFELWFNPPETGSGSSENMLAYRVHFLALVGLMTALAGLIGAPLALIRVFSTERQVKATEEGLLTDRINKAVEGLGAEKTVKQVHETPQYRKDEDGEWIRDENGDPVPALRPDGQPIIDRQVVERSVPNLEVRIGAIYALERIAKLNLGEHIQIMEILTAYIRENAPAKDAPELPELPDYFEGEDEDGETWRDRFETWEMVHPEALSVIKPRADIQVAITVIGRRSDGQRALERGDWKPFEEAVGAWQERPEADRETDAYRRAMKARADEVRKWRDTKPSYRLDLRECNLTKADMAKGDFSSARFEGARMQGADLNGAQMQAVTLWPAQMQRARFGGANMMGTVLSATEMQGASFEGAQMREVSLIGVKMQGADLDAVQMQGARLLYAQMQCTLLWGARLQGTNFEGAQMQEADLSRAQFDETTNFRATKIQMAAVPSVVFAGRHLAQSQIDSVFGDASTTLPDGFSRPAHWPDFDMEYEEFRDEWEKWKANPDAYVPPQAPDAS